MFNDDKDQNQDQMKSPVYGLIPGWGRDTSSPADGFMSFGKDNGKHQLEIIKRVPAGERNGGQIQGPFARINSSDIEEFIDQSVYNSVCKQYNLECERMILLNLLSQFKDFPGIDVEYLVKKAFKRAIRDIKRNYFNRFNEDDDEEGEL